MVILDEMMDIIMLVPMVGFIRNGLSANYVFCERNRGGGGIS